MKQQILDVLKNIHEAKELIEINDLMGLKTADEYKQLQDAIQELVDEYLSFIISTTKEKSTISFSCFQKFSLGIKILYNSVYLLKLISN